MSQVDWSKAPSDAQAYMPASGSWFAGWWKREGTQSYFCETKGNTHTDWQASGAKPWGYPGMVNRPATPQWSGPQDGLPPIGLNLQWLSDRYGWIGGKVVAHDQNTTIVRHNDGYAGCHLHELRLTESPEQKAARERDLSVNEMWTIYRDSKVQTVEEALGRIYDAGYRKQAKP